MGIQELIVIVVVLGVLCLMAGVGVVLYLCLRTPPGTPPSAFPPSEGRGAGG